ncbi:hypothetical protein [uncultured Dubosiella sp.]|uniref:hypothetical protein n=2 Tax=uncultured Dubosiella sp. TaxID=1937011 RepID=UPI00262CC498|nr:hypothetical protein [uncultured Dubosiella sp.]
MKRKYYIQKSLTDLPEYRTFCGKAGLENIHLYEDLKDLEKADGQDIVVCDDREWFPKLGISGYRMSHPKDVIRFSTLAPFRYYYTVMNILSGLLVAAFLLSVVLFFASPFSIGSLVLMIALATVSGSLIFRPLDPAGLLVLFVAGMIFIYNFAYSF